MTADDRIHALVSGVLDRVRNDLQREVTGLLDALRAYTADERDEAARVARAEAETAAAALASGAIAAERVVFEDRLADVRQKARAEAQATAQAEERQVHLAGAERLTAAVRLLDSASSLSDTLDALAEAAQAEAGRAAVFLVRGDELRGWAHSGFDASTPDARSLTYSLDTGGVLSEAVQSRSVASTADSHGHAAADVPSPFTLPSQDRVGLAVPLIVDDNVVAVLYADDAGSAHEAPSAWPERVELLARHASRCLEALTARRAVQARSGPRETPSEALPDEEAARRYARLLVSEIKMYHEAAVDEGRRAKDLRARLGPQIERARHLYEERIPAGLQARAEVFEQELVRTLADGDAALMGQAT